MWKFYSDLLTQMQKCNTRSEKFNIYPECVLRSLGLAEDVQWINAERVERSFEDLRNLLEQHIDSGIPMDKHQAFFDKFKKYADTIYNGKNKLKNDCRSGPKIMSDFLDEQKETLGVLYVISGRGTWKIEKRPL